MVTIKISLGGEERELKFGKMGFFNHVGDVFNGDPIELVNGSATPSKQYEIVFACVYAGLKCAGSQETKETVNEWVMDMEYSDGAKVMIAFQQGYATSNGQAGEAEARKLVEVN